MYFKLSKTHNTHFIDFPSRLFSISKRCFSIKRKKGLIFYLWRNSTTEKLASIRRTHERFICALAFRENEWNNQRAAYDKCNVTKRNGNERKRAFGHARVHSALFVYFLRDVYTYRRRRSFGRERAARREFGTSAQCCECADLCSIVLDADPIAAMVVDCDWARPIHLFTSHISRVHFRDCIDRAVSFRRGKGDRCRGQTCHRRQRRAVSRTKASSSRSCRYRWTKTPASTASPAWFRACRSRRSTRRRVCGLWRAICTGSSWQTSRWSRVSLACFDDNARSRVASVKPPLCSDNCHHWRRIIVTMIINKRKKISESINHILFIIRHIY